MGRKEHKKSFENISKKVNRCVKTVKEKKNYNFCRHIIFAVSAL